MPKRFHAFLAVLSILLFLVMTACAGSPTITPQSGTRSPVEGGTTGGAAPPSAAADNKGGTGSSAGLPDIGQQQAVDERKIIRTGSLALIVRNPDDAASQIKAIVEGMQGYVQTSQISDSGQYRTGNVQVKVPSESFFGAMDQIKRIAIKVRSENSTANDVTEEYTDLETQLRTLRTQYDTYLEMLKTARTTDDVLRIRARLGELQGQINRLEGRRNFLDRNAAMSTINISLTMPEAAQPVVDGNWDFVAVVMQALRAFVTFTQGIATLLVWLVIFGWPFVLLFLALRWWLARRPRRPEMQYPVQQPPMQSPPPPPPASA